MGKQGVKQDTRRCSDDGISKQSDSETRDELLGALSLNTSDYIQSYDGNPLTYHVFKLSFDQIVYPIKDYERKLTQLLGFTTEDAQHAIIEAMNVPLKYLNLGLETKTELQEALRSI